MRSEKARLEIRALNKTFGSVQVLSDVDLSVLAGEVHGLAGQNGSGKSTLIKILTGLYTPDPGAEYHVDGRPIRLPVRWPEVRAAGISVVHQDLGLLDQLSVAENICVGGFPTVRTGRIDRLQRDRVAERTLARLGVEIEPCALVSTLTAPERAEVAIARAMRDHAEGSGLIILDESTRALTGADLQRIHDLLRRIAAEGSAALMISHNLIELMAISDRVTILRDGKVAGAGLSTHELSEAEIARRMLGTTLGGTHARSKCLDPIATPTITVTGLGGTLVSGVSFSLGRGEILGITGLPGSGYEQIPYLLTGAQLAKTGNLKIGKRSLDLARAGIRGCLRAGVVLVPERRDRDGLALELSVRDNVSLPGLRGRGSAFYVGRKWQREAAEAAAEQLDIRPRTPSMLVKQLSGGNQQKVLLAKWLTMSPSALVLHEPTQAVDVGARQDILHALRSAADEGVAVILVSSESDDLAAACDRVLVYRAGTGMHQVDSFTPDDLIKQIYALGETPEQAATIGSPI